jgi:hypothetical protein
MDFEVTVKYLCPNVCSEEELEGKTPREIFEELTSQYPELSLYSEGYEILDVKIKEDV